MVGVTDVPGVTKAIEASGGRVLAQIPLIDVLVAEIPETALPGLQHNPNVRFIEEDPAGAVWTQEDTLVYGVDNINAEVVWGGAENATNVIPRKGGAGVNVAVIDTGIDCGHADLTANCGTGINYVSKGKDPFDDHGHGTHVAGIIAARDNGIGVIGVAPEATLYAVKVLDANGSGSWSSVANGIVWATQHGMDVINMSLGGTSISQAVADAVQAASDAGVLVVSAAGNSGCCDTVLYPAKLPESMAVAAVDANDQRASFSSTGVEVDVAAPGVAILSTVPTGSCKLCDASGHRTLSGTSMATPHVAGAAALLISRGLSAAQAWEHLAGTPKDLSYVGFDHRSCRITVRLIQIGSTHGMISLLTT
jgi:subtilisin